MWNDAVRARDPGWSQQLVAIAVGSIVPGVAAWAVAGWIVGLCIAALLALVSVVLVARFFDRRTLEISGTRIRVIDSSGERILDVAELTRVDASEGYHVGMRLDLHSEMDVVSDVDPGDAGEFLLGLGAALRQLDREAICAKAARPFLGIELGGG